MSLCSIYNKRSNREKIKRNFSDGTRYRTTDLRSAVKVTADASAAGAAGNFTAATEKERRQRRWGLHYGRQAAVYACILCSF